jgi:hypothetical protein
MKGGAMSNPADEHLVYSIAHHDTWWAKGALWTTTSWAITLQGVVVGLGLLYFRPESASWSLGWPFTALLFLISIGTAAYLGQLHYDTARSRVATTYLRESRPELNRVYESIPKVRGFDPKAPDQEDHLRGWHFVALLMVSTTTGGALGAEVVTKSVPVALTFAAVQGFCSSWFLWRAIKNGEKVTST